ncbi:UNVERIFIED_CONTAM: hypothetical protein GTU68_016595 [Idotea baltica]|nr:hypothetical protein [Idotea baltica]
MSAVTKVI